MNAVTRILNAIEQGDPHAANELLPLVYDELRRLAAQQLAREKPGQTTSRRYASWTRAVVSSFGLEKAKEEALYRGEPASYWIGQLKDGDPSFRRQAMWALAHLGAEEGSVQALVELLKDKSEGIRSAAALNLGRIGAAAKTAVPQLLRVLGDEDNWSA